MPSSPGVENPVADGAGLSKWQRARLVLDQYQRGVDAGPVGQVLPVRAELAQLLPHGGLRRGSTVVVRGSTTVLLALLAEATAGGAWAAVVGMPDLGVLAAAELGVEISRLALVPKPGAEVGAVVAALLDGVDLVVVAQDVGQSLARRLSARARHRESVMLTTVAWPGADVALDCGSASWSGLGEGFGHLTGYELAVTSQGRGAALQAKHYRVTFTAPLHPSLGPTPDHDGTTLRITTTPTPSARPCSTLRACTGSDVVSSGGDPRVVTAGAPRPLRPVAPPDRSHGDSLAAQEDQRPAELRIVRPEPVVDVSLPTLFQLTDRPEWPTRLARLPGPLGTQPPTPADPEPFDSRLIDLDFAPYALTGAELAAACDTASDPVGVR